MNILNRKIREVALNKIANKLSIEKKRLGTTLLNPAVSAKSRAELELTLRYVNDEYVKINLLIQSGSLLEIKEYLETILRSFDEARSAGTSTPEMERHHAEILESLKLINEAYISEKLDATKASRRRRTAARRHTASRHPPPACLNKIDNIAPAPPRL